MREIKFRAWDKKRKKMFRVLGTSIPTYAGSEELWLRLEKYTKSSLQFPAKDFELMQFTGLTDKNGKEIYEGDIIKHSYRSDLTVIEWHEKQAQWSMGGYQSDTVEVIGNIYENLELLEVKE